MTQVTPVGVLALRQLHAVARVARNTLVLQGRPEHLAQRPDAGKSAIDDWTDKPRPHSRLGQRLWWDRRELHHIDGACREADHVELLQQRLDAEAAGENLASILVKIVAEVRNLDRSIADHLNRVQIGNLLVAKSPQHHAAATARWGVNRPPKRVVG